ncbi:MAG: HAMP domain-containing sensor histidine kinase [Planctomycetota bacterium]
MILRSSDESVLMTQRSLSPSPPSWPDLAGASSVDWLSAARRCPDLARILIVATLDRFPVAEGALADWPRQFLARPHWQSVANRLLESSFDDQNTNHRQALALLAASIATMTRWTNLESAFWISLAGKPEDHESLRSMPISRSLEELPGHVRGRQLALWILVEQPYETEIVATPNQGLLPAERLYRVLNHAYSSVDWSAIFDEASSLRNVRALDLDRENRRRLARFAELAAARDELTLRNLAFELYRANDDEAFLHAAVALIACATSTPLALWLHDRGNEGLGILTSAELGNGETKVLREPLAVFESQLPGSLRATLEIQTDNGSMLGKVYLTSNASSPAQVFPWIAEAHARLPKARVDQPNQDSLAIWDNRIRETEAKFREAIAEFSAGAGHEINNPLGAILGQAQWLLQGESDPKRRHSLQKITEQVARIRRMIRDLRLIGRPIGPKRSPVLLAPILEHAVAQAAKRSEGATLHFRDNDLAVQVLGDADELSRMFEEIFVNGLEAAGTEGQVTVRVSLGMTPPTRNKAARPAIPAVLIETIDSGPGFSRDDLRLAWTPFYSGRSAGRGLGMGMPVADRIAHDHDGSIHVDRGLPTRVRIILPTLEMNSKTNVA